MSTPDTDTPDADKADNDDVAGHFQLPPETFDDDALPLGLPAETVIALSGTTDIDDDVAGHFRSYPKAADDGADEDVEGHHLRG